MTEAEWLACVDPKAMLVFLKGKATKRQLRLLGCACLGRVAHLLIDDRARDAIATAERFADGSAGEAELKKARVSANRARYPGLNESGLGNAGYYLHCMATEIARLDRAFRPAVVCDFAGSTLREAGGNPRGEYAAQAALARDIFGNPFRKPMLDKTWRTSSALSLARQMYESRDFSAMPILADALQDAGCDNEGILAHCRGEGPHVRGCWVVDLVLGII
jgi:hypothetical protein